MTEGAELGRASLGPLARERGGVGDAGTAAPCPHGRGDVV